MDSIPFKLPDVGLSEVQGYVYFDDEFLVFDVETALFGEFNGEEQTIKIEPKAINDLEYEKGVFKDKLFVRPKKRDLLKAMPGSFDEEIKLRVAHKHRKKVRRLIKEFYKRIADTE